MSSDSRRPLMNGTARRTGGVEAEMDKLNKQLQKPRDNMQQFHGDELIGVGVIHTSL
jgi:hypothetical protein